MDSDSDGFDDMEEVFSGNDPNCPTGNDCGVIVSSEDTGDSSASAGALVDPFGSASEYDEAMAEAGVSFDDPESVQEFFKQATMDEIRAALLAAGMAQEQLDIIDDATLEAYFTGQLEIATESGVFDELVTDSTDQTNE